MTRTVNLAWWVTGSQDSLVEVTVNLAWWVTGSQDSLVEVTVNLARWVTESLVSRVDRFAIPASDTPVG